MKWECFCKGHDKVTIKKQEPTYVLGYYYGPKTIKVCLRCKRIWDEITPYLKLIERLEYDKKSRKEKAEDIYERATSPKYV